MSPFTNMFSMHKGFLLLNRLFYSVAFRSVEVLLTCSVNLYFHKLTQPEALFEYTDVFLTLRKQISFLLGMGLDSDSYYIGNCLPHFYEKIVLTRIVYIDIKLSKKTICFKIHYRDILLKHRKPSCRESMLTKK